MRGERNLIKSCVRKYILSFALFNTQNNKNLSLYFEWNLVYEEVVDHCKDEFVNTTAALKKLFFDCNS